MGRIDIIAKSPYLKFLSFIFDAFIVLLTSIQVFGIELVTEVLQSVYTHFLMAAYGLTYLSIPFHLVTSRYAEKRGEKKKAWKHMGISVALMLVSWYIFLILWYRVSGEAWFCNTFLVSSVLFYCR